LLGRAARPPFARTLGRTLRLLQREARCAVQRRHVRELFLQRAPAAGDPEQRAGTFSRQRGENPPTQSALDCPEPLRFSGWSAAPPTVCQAVWNQGLELALKKLGVIKIG